MRGYTSSEVRVCNEMHDDAFLCNKMHCTTTTTLRESIFRVSLYYNIIICAAITICNKTFLDDCRSLLFLFSDGHGCCCRRRHHNIIVM